MSTAAKVGVTIPTINGIAHFVVDMVSYSYIRSIGILVNTLKLACTSY